MDGIIFILDQLGRNLKAALEENEALRQQIVALSQRAAAQTIPEPQ